MFGARKCAEAGEGGRGRNRNESLSVGYGSPTPTPSLHGSGDFRAPPFWRTFGRPPCSENVRLSMDNLQLYGLDPTDPSGSLCTCMRELVENALDAVGTNSAHTDLALIQRESTHVVEAAQHRSLSISLEPQDGMGSQWKLRVVDDGTGFADSALSSLRMLFANGHSTALATPMNSSSSLHGGVHVADARAGAFGIGLKSRAPMGSSLRST